MNIPTVKSADIFFSHGFLALIMVLSAIRCSSSEMHVSEYKFRYDNKDYIVRSAYCAGDPQSCNHLIGEDFIAVDMNQDRIIDKIHKGDISIRDAQKIYDYSLDLLKRENKLNEISSRDDRYLLMDRNYNFEITSFFPGVNEPFNEFKITDKRDEWNPKVYVLLDEKADGQLDEILKGQISLEEAQKHYDYVISKGFADNKLMKNNGSILTK